MCITVYQLAHLRPAFAVLLDRSRKVGGIGWGAGQVFRFIHGLASYACRLNGKTFAPALRLSK